MSTSRRSAFNVGPARAMLAVASLGCLLTVLAGSAHGQASSSAVNGTVTDQQGAVVPGTEVVLTSVETGIERRAEANAVGQYVFVNIPPGYYTIDATEEGFRTAAIEPFVLVVNQTATFDIVLEVGAVTESVTVEAIGAQVQASSSELGTAMTEQQVVDLPLNGRNFTQLLMLTPGASPVNVAQNRGGFGSTSVGTFSFPSINGQNNRSNLFLTDGVNNQGTMTSTYAVPPILDAIQEFKVQSHNDLSEFGAVTGGVVNVVTKSGTNEHRGSLWSFLRNDNLDARNTFLRDKAALAQNMFGGTIGGPVVGNRTFYFGAFQGFTNRTPANRNYRVPTAANRTGDLGDSARQIFDPYSTRTGPDGNAVRDPFRNNAIPQSRLDPGFVYYLEQTVPMPIDLGTDLGNLNQRDTTGTALDQYEYSARLDHRFSDSDTAYMRWSGQDNYRIGSAGRQNFSSFVDITNLNVAANWVHTFDPTSIMQVSFARTDVKRDTGNAFAGLPDGFISTVGWNPDFAGGFRGGTSYVPNVGVAQYFGGGERIGYTRTSDTWQYKGTYTKIVGTHTLKFGAEYNVIGHFGRTNDHTNGFSTVGTASPDNPGGTGHPLASFLLNVPNRWSRRDFHKRARGGALFSFFGQDSWKVTPRLTINFGMRVDRTVLPQFGNPEENTVEFGNIDYNEGIYWITAAPPTCEVKRVAPCLPDAGGTLPDRVQVASQGYVQDPWPASWQPRFGFAYRLNERTAIRASSGVFFDNFAGVTQNTQNLGHTWPDVGRKLQNGTNPADSLPSVSAKNPAPTGILPTATPYNQGAWYSDPRMDNAYSMQWNFGIQRQLDDATLLQVNYVGSGNRRLPLGTYYNVALTPGRRSEARQRAPFPLFRANNYLTSWGRSSYHSLQTQYNRRFSKGLSFMVNYTWAKAIDIGCSGWFVENCSQQNPYNFNLDRSVSGIDLTHNLNLNWVFELPFKFSSRALNAILGGWKFNGLALFTSGQPYTPNVNGDIAGTGLPNGRYRPDYVGNPVLSNPTPAAWINTSAFAVPQTGTFGNAGRNTLRADGINNIDFSFFKIFSINERLRVEYRAEFFNGTNTPQYAAPSSNISRGNFGRVLRTANRARQIQMGLKLYF
ncbi:MAG: carboxypeptidase regulatory-like domain-containing protein [Bryobacterales bacterium]|nr:carboxypeptidase regulatory-like domain-containing protein [Bryobacterales bacterium]